MGSWGTARNCFLAEIAEGKGETPRGYGPLHPRAKDAENPSNTGRIGFLRQAHGFDLDLSGIAPLEYEMMDLHQRLMWEYADEPMRGDAGDAGAHPLLGARIAQPGDVVAFQRRLGADLLGTPILPDTAYLEMALEAGRRVLGVDVESHGVRFLAPMTFGPESNAEGRAPALARTGGREARLVDVRVDQRDGRFQIHSAPIGEDVSWTLHCAGVVARATPAPADADPLLEVPKVPAEASADPFLEVRWIPIDADAEGRAALHEEIARVANESLRELATREDAAGYDRFVDVLEARSAAYVRDALLQLGWNPRAEERVAEADLAERLGIVPAHRRLFSRMLAIAEEERVIERDGLGSRWRVLRDLSSWAVRDSGGSEAERAGAPAERVLLDRCGPSLADLVRGVGDPLELLFPGGATAAADAERMYYDAPFARILNGAIADLVASAAAAAHADGRVLRVLEVGGGTAGTTRRVLDHLDASGLPVAYTFTDVSTAFLERGRDRWANRTDIEYRTFDLDVDLAAQGFETGTYDVVVAANCLHAARDLGAALGRVRGLLRPGGVLAAVEVFGPHRWFDLTVGLTAGWWHFTDASLRPDYPCIGATAWTALLGDAGFDGVSAIPLAKAGPSRGYASRNQGLVLAHRAATPAARGRWLLAGDGGTTDTLPGELAARGCIVTTVTMKELGTALRAGPAAWAIAKSDGLKASAREKKIDPNEPWRGVVVREPASAGRSLSPRAVSAAVRGGLEPLIDLAKAVGANEAKCDRLFLLSRGAQVVTPADVDVDAAGATAWGLARALELELPELPVYRLDLAPTSWRGEAATVVEWLLDPPTEPELAWRFGRLHARRVALREGTREESSAGSTRPLPSEYRLAPPTTRAIDALVFTPGERRAPGPGEVEIRAVASAMNFKDVLSVLGMYPGDAGPLGSESAGVVTAVGEGVDLPIGAAVMAAAGHGYGRHVVADARMVATKPESMTFAEAAGLPIAYLTAHFALNHLAGIGPGDRVLIHAAAGGVGLAAVAIAQRAGAEVFATAGSEWKRDLLRAAGVREVFDSRSASFAARITEATSDQGVTVVLNSLGDELIERTFAVTAAGGRFLEIGKRGIWSPERVAALGKDIEYHIIDWGQTAKDDPDLVARLFADVMGAVAAGDLPLLPVRTFPLERVVEAFRFMAQGRHAGKVVLEHPVLADFDPIHVKSEDASEGAWLITGGTSGLGLATAEWLAGRGTHELVLASRNGVRPENEARVEAIRERGVAVHVVAADVGNPVAVKRLQAELRTTGVSPIRGIVHSAGALSNRTLQQAKWSDFDKVLRAKVHGSLLLADAFAADTPEHFVLYSSIASVFGAPGQANHSAANAFEDAFAAAGWRLARRGMSIAWGPWSETGAAASEDILAQTRDRGLDAFSTSEGLRWLEAAFDRPATQLIGTRVVDPDALSGGRGRLLDELRRQVPAPTSKPGCDAAKANRRTEVALTPDEAVPGAGPAARSLLGGFHETPVDACLPPADDQIRTLLIESVGAPIVPPRARVGTGSITWVGTEPPPTEAGVTSVITDNAVDDVGAAVDSTAIETADTVETSVESSGSTDISPAVPQTASAGTIADTILDELDLLDDDEIERLLLKKVRLP